MKTPPRCGCGPRKSCALFAFGLTLAAIASAAETREDLGVLGRWPRYQHAPHAVYHYLVDRADALLQQREAEVGKIASAAAWRTRQERVLQILRAEMLGPFPEKTPLRPRVTGIVRQAGYRVEKIIYESVPGLYVTAALFVPDAAPQPAAAILFASGHTADAFRNRDPGSSYLWMILNLVRKGFIVFAFDPLSQGERAQYFDANKGVSRLGKASAQHGYMGLPPQLTRYSLAQAMTWDGIRAIDYLETRPEVDRQRLGMFGNSGGGTQTAYVSAVDRRIRAAAPGNFITSFRRLLQTRGPQDPEQYLYRQIALGIDHADYLLARAPRPTLVVATTRDFFNIQGTRETSAEVQRAFALLGSPRNFALVEDDFEHGYTRKTREATYAFFQQHLELPGSPADENVELPAPAELQVTPTGQVATSLGGESFSSVARKTATPLFEALAARRQDPAAHLGRVLEAARGLSGHQAPVETRGPIFAGRYQRNGYAVEKFMLEEKQGYPVPFLVFAPAGGGRHPGLIYLHPKGKAAQAGAGGEIEALVRAGHVVLAPDLAGIGETAPNADAWEMAMLIGRSLVGLRAGDIVRLVRVLQARPDVNPERIAGVARGETGAGLLHAAAFEPALARVALIESLVSYRALLEEEYFAARFGDEIVAHALTAYDLPDLAASLAPRPLIIINPQDGHGDGATADAVNRELAVVRRAYASGSSEGFRAVLVEESRPVIEALLNWLH